MKNAKANIYVILGIITLSITLFELGKPLYNLWVNQPGFDRVQEIIDFFETPILIGLLVAWIFERRARKIDILERVKSEEAIEARLLQAIDDKIKESLEDIIDNKLVPIHTVLDRIDKRVYELNGDKKKNE